MLGVPSSLLLEMTITACEDGSSFVNAGEGLSLQNSKFNKLDKPCPVTPVDCIDSVALIMSWLLILWKAVQRKCCVYRKKKLLSDIEVRIKAPGICCADCECTCEVEDYKLFP